MKVNIPYLLKPVDYREKILPVKYIQVTPMPSPNNSGYCLCNSYTMDCHPVRGNNPRALASGLSYVQVDKHGKTILYHLHQC